MLNPLLLSLTVSLHAIGPGFTGHMTALCLRPEREGKGRKMLEVDDGPLLMADLLQGTFHAIPVQGTGEDLLTRLLEQKVLRVVAAKNFKKKFTGYLQLSSWLAGTRKP